MKKLIIAYHDKKMNYYLPLATIADTTDDNLIEEVKRMVCSDSCPLQYLEYDLYRFGSFDDKSGEIISYKPEFIVSLGDFRSLKEDVKNVQG